LNFRRAFIDSGLKLSGCLIWRKNSLVLGRSDYQWQHEPILYGWRQGAAHRWLGDRKQTTMAELHDGSPFVPLGDGRWQITVGTQTFVVAGDAVVSEAATSVISEERPKRSDLHPTQKPVALIERLLRNSVQPGDTVLDPFGGSGSTLIACERLGLSARLIELDMPYVDVIVKRWQDYTGLKATRESDGALFDSIHPVPVPVAEAA
jgi:DNA modification methylase